MKKTNPILILILVIFFFSCKKEVSKKSIMSSNSTTVSLLDTLKLKLNKGDKWVVNNETQIGITKMDSIIKSFKKESVKNYENLGNKLSKQTSFIIKSCDMTGEAHDQLHVVLVPMLDEISVLKESNNTNECKRALIKLEGLIDNYFNHFKE